MSFHYLSKYLYLYMYNIAISWFFVRLVFPLFSFSVFTYENHRKAPIKRVSPVKPYSVRADFARSLAQYFFARTVFLLPTAPSPHTQSRINAFTRERENEGKTFIQIATATRAQITIIVIKRMVVLKKRPTFKL